MIYKTIQPSQHLQHIVKDYSLLHFKCDSIQIKPFPANTRHCLVFYLKGTVNCYDFKESKFQTFPKISINGTQISRYNFHLDNEFLMLSVNFNPTGLSKFLRMPITEFTDKRINANDLLDNDISQIYERLVNIISYDEMISILEKYLWNRIKRINIEIKPIDRVTNVLSISTDTLSIKKLASHSCLSVSQFERLFYKINGVTPKFYYRINRFNNAYQMKELNPKTDWLSIAIQFGYYDYQHLVSDFKTFSLTVPNSLIQQQALSPERVLNL